MSLTSILILVGLALIIFLLSLWPRTRALRKLLLLVFSVGVIFWLQPALPIRGLDFWLPVATLALVALGWLLTSKAEEREVRATLVNTGLVISTVLLIALTRYVSLTGWITPSRPPQTLIVVAVLCAIFAVLFLLFIFSRRVPLGAGALVAAMLAILLVFVVLKLPALTQWISEVLRGWNGQSRELASSIDLRWLGFSYIAFRLIHTLRDRQSGRLPAMALDEYFIYVLFFPAISAGPIDRSERFLRDLRKPFIPAAEELGGASKRLVIGLFKKFVLADLLALIALNGTNASQLTSTGWAWLLVYAYALQIFFDFSGYTDIAIGMGLLMGVKFPENFNAPYLKPNLTQFWNNWHMTLTQWFRAYFFNPLTRALRSAKKPVPVWLVILITQISTMLLIGLWHGMTLNFILWGLWHGLGMFIQNRWSDWTRPLSTRIQQKPALNRIVTIFTTLLTFQFVAMGWVWFALPSVQTSLDVFTRLFGMGG